MSPLEKSANKQVCFLRYCRKTNLKCTFSITYSCKRVQTKRDNTAYKRILFCLVKSVYKEDDTVHNCCGDFGYPDAEHYIRL